jgi:hypothetical protein
MRRYIDSNLNSPVFLTPPRGAMYAARVSKLILSPLQEDEQRPNGEDDVDDNEEDASEEVVDDDAVILASETFAALRASLCRDQSDSADPEENFDSDEDDNKSAANTYGEEGIYDTENLPSELQGQGDLGSEDDDGSAGSAQEAGVLALEHDTPKTDDDEIEGEASEQSPRPSTPSSDSPREEIDACSGSANGVSEEGLKDERQFQPRVTQAGSGVLAELSSLLVGPALKEISNVRASENGPVEGLSGSAQKILTFTFDKNAISSSLGLSCRALCGHGRDNLVRHSPLPLTAKSKTSVSPGGLSLLQERDPLYAQAEAVLAALQR